MHAAISPPAAIQCERSAVTNQQLPGTGAECASEVPRGSLGTATSTDTRRVRICRTISCGLYPRMKTATPGMSGRMNIVSAWPNMWLSGIRLRKRSGNTGRNHLAYFETICSGETMLARMFPCVIRTPFGSPVAPEVNTISTTSSLSMSNRRALHSSR